MKKNYSTPSLVSMKINAESIMAGSKEVMSVDGGSTNVGFYGGGKGPSRAREILDTDLDLEEDFEIEFDE